MRRNLTDVLFLIVGPGVASAAATPFASKLRGSKAARPRGQNILIVGAPLCSLFCIYMDQLGTENSTCTDRTTKPREMIIDCLNGKFLFLPRRLRMLTLYDRQPITRRSRANGPGMVFARGDGRAAGIYPSLELVQEIIRWRDRRIHTQDPSQRRSC